MRKRRNGMAVRAVYQVYFGVAKNAKSRISRLQGALLHLFGHVVWGDTTYKGRCQNILHALNET